MAAHVIICFNIHVVAYSLESHLTQRVLRRVILVPILLIHYVAAHVIFFRLSHSLSFFFSICFWMSPKQGDSKK